MMYTAIKHQVFINGELFITIHPTNSTVSIVEQASMVAAMLNEFTEKENESDREELE